MRGEEGWLLCISLVELVDEVLGVVVLLLGEDNESSNRTTAHIASAPGAMTLGRCLRWSKTVLREDRSGSSGLGSRDCVQ